MKEKTNQNVVQSPKNRSFIKIDVRADLRVLYGWGGGGSLEFIKFLIICVYTLQTDGRSRERNP